MNRSGFTLLELLVVLGIIAILALMMAPSYLDQIVRRQLMEALPLAEIAKAPVAASWAAARAFPADNAAAGLPPPEKIVSNYVSSVTVRDGAIQIVFGNGINSRIRGRTLTLRPAVVEDAPVVPVAWICGNAAVPPQMSARGENRTDVPAAFLPYNCRAS